jgi:predicted component of type VI protein secretion system
MPRRAESEIKQLTHEVRKLRQSIDRVQQGLLNTESAARYLSISDVTFRSYVARGLVPVTDIDPDSAVRRFSRAALDRLIEQRTHAQGDVQ